jgi:hypothetical protein
MAGHIYAMVFSVCARSGHTTGTTIESYPDKNNVLRGLPEANSLIGCDNLHSRVVLPSFKPLKDVNNVQVDALVCEMSPKNIRAF